MYKNIIPSLISLETTIKKIKGFYFGASSNFYESITKKNAFHYKISINNNITIPNDYDFLNGNFYKKGNVWYYQRKIGPIVIKFLYDQKNRVFSYNRAYSFIPFEIGHIFPPGRHLADLIVLDLFMKGLVFIRGCAVKYSGKNLAFIAPSHNGKTSLVKQIIESGGKYVSEEFFILDIKSKSIFPTPCLYLDGKLVNQRLKEKLNIKNIITKKIHIDKFILFLNQGTEKNKYEKRNFFDFVILRSLFFFKNDFIKSYIFAKNITNQVFKIINNLQKIKVNYENIRINNYKFGNLFK